MAIDDLEHPLIAIVTVVVFHLLGHANYGVWAACGFFVGREHAQAEYRWIAAYGHQVRADMPWWGGFDLRIWNNHSWFWNLVLPILVAIITFGFMQAI